MKDKEKEEKIAVPTVEEMYSNGKDLLDAGKHKQAVEKFEEVERTYPYSRWAIKAQVMEAYANYQDEEYGKAIDAIERFVRLHPGNSDVAYMYYLKALCLYEQISSPENDQTYTVETQKALKEVISRFPESSYARDARMKLDLANDYLAAKQLAVGRYYLKRGNYTGAINRFRKIIDHYDTTVYVPEALHRIVEAYMRLGVKSEAQKYAAVLGYNFPGNKWYERSYQLIEGTSPESADITTDSRATGWQRFTTPLKSLKMPFMDKK